MPIITDVRVQSLLLADTHIFSPALVQRPAFHVPPPQVHRHASGQGENLAATIGLTGVSDAAFPAFMIPGYGVPAGTSPASDGSNTGAALGNPTAVSRFQTPILDQQILDALSWSHGTHAFKFGGEYPASAPTTKSAIAVRPAIFTISPLITEPSRRRPEREMRSPASSSVR